MKDKVKVLFITGGQRSGSTILLRVLGQIEFFFGVGELWYIWERSLKENRLCGCGQTFDKCDFWRRVFLRTFGTTNKSDFQKMVSLVDDGVRTRHIPLYLTKAGQAFMKEVFGDRLNKIDDLYSGIQQETSCDVIIDSSKHPTYGFLLQMLPSIDLHIVHLVRDSRAVAYSWQRKKLQVDTNQYQYMAQINPLKTAVTWLTWNLTCQIFKHRQPDRYLRIKYEDWVSSPLLITNQILDFVGEPPLREDFFSDGNVNLEGQHMISGNPNRFQLGSVTLKLDREWHSSMSRFSKLIVSIITFPLLILYGYWPKYKQIRPC